MNFESPLDNKTEIASTVPSLENKNLRKENISSVFQLRPELGIIGTEEQYSDYLSTIFPESKVKDILWHTSDTEFQHFDLSKSKAGTYGTGIYFDKELRIESAPFKYPAVVDLKKPLEISHHLFKDPEDLHRIFDLAYDFLQAEKEFNKNEISDEQKREIIFHSLLGATSEEFAEYKKNLPSLEGVNSIEEYFQAVENLIGNDGVIQYSDSDYKSVQEYTVFLPSQIRVLGSQEDIEHFKHFMSSKKSETDSTAVI